MISDFKVHIERKRTKSKEKMQRLYFIKQRYEKLILRPKKEIEFEIDSDLREERNYEDEGLKGCP